MAKATSPSTIEKFKGLHTAIPPGHIDETEFASLINWNVPREGVLVKRKGLYNVVNTVYGGTNARVLLIQRTIPNGDFLLWTDGSKLFRTALPGLTSNTEMLLSGVSIPSITWGVESGSATSPSNCYLTKTATGGTIVIDQNGTVSQVATGAAGTQTVIFKARQWVIHNLFTTGAENRITYSAAGDLSQWPASNFIDVNPGDGQFLTALQVYNDQLLIFKNRSTYILTADGDPSYWRVRNIHPTIGCPGRGTPQLINGFVYFYSGTSVYRTDGTTFEDLGLAIRDQFYGIPYNTATITNQNDATFWDNKYILKLYNNPTLLYVYDVYADTWTTWNLAGTSAVNGFVRYPEYAPDGFYTGNPNTGKLQRMGDNWFIDDTVGMNPGGTNYSATAWTKMTTFGNPSNYKRHHLTEIDYGADTNAADTLTCSYAKDNNVTIAGVSKTVNQNSPNSKLRFPGAGRSRTFQHRIVHSGTGSCTIYDIVAAIEVKDRTSQGI